MTILEFAGVRFGFHTDLELGFQDDMRLFRREGNGPCDYEYRVISAPLPPMPEEQPFYGDFLLRAWRSEAETRIYHRLPNSPWSFCLVERDGERTIYVTPQATHYTRNIWNVYDKVEFSSRMLEKRAVLLHAAYIVHEGQAILFTAPSGVGKSTQAGLWQEHLGARIINGDRAIIREIGGRLYACGVPFSGSSGICQDHTAPLRAIVTLSQAPENWVRPMTRHECTRFFCAQTTIRRWKPEDLIGTLELWDDFIQKVPVLHLACRPDRDAVETLHRTLEEIALKGDQK